MWVELRLTHRLFNHVDPWTAELEPRLPQPACVAASTSDPLALAAFWPRGAARLLFFCVCTSAVFVAAPPRAPSFLRRASNTNWQRPSPLSSLLSSLPFPSPNTGFFFSLPAGKKVKKKKIESNNPSPSCNRRSPVNTVSLLCLSCGKKKNTMPRGSGGNIYQNLSSSRFISSCFSLLSFVCFPASSLPLRRGHSPSLSTSSLPLFSNYFNFSCHFKAAR